MNYNIRQAMEKFLIRGDFMQKSQLLFILGLILAIVVTIFALTNANPVVVNLLFYKFEASLALIIFLSAALGAIIVISLGLKKQLELIKAGKLLRKSNEELATQNQYLSDELDKISSNIVEIEDNKEDVVVIDEIT